MPHPEEFSRHLAEYSDELAKDMIRWLVPRLRADGFDNDDVSIPIVCAVGTTLAITMVLSAERDLPGIRHKMRKLMIERIRKELA
jgi:hypothetical protein